MSGREVDVGGEGPIFKYARTKLESEFLTITLRSGVRKRGRALERMVLCVVLAVGPLPGPPTSTLRLPDVIHVMNAPRPSPFFAGPPLACIIVNAN